jgi:hypothetical protein
MDGADPGIVNEMLANGLAAGAAPALAAVGASPPLLALTIRLAFKTSSGARWKEPGSSSCPSTQSRYNHMSKLVAFGVQEHL